MQHFFKFSYLLRDARQKPPMWDSPASLGGTWPPYCQYILALLEPCVIVKWIRHRQGDTNYNRQKAPALLHLNARTTQKHILHSGTVQLCSNLLTHAKLNWKHFTKASCVGLLRSVCAVLLFVGLMNWSGIFKNLICGAVKEMNLCIKKKPQIF